MVTNQTFLFSTKLANFSYFSILFVFTCRFILKFTCYTFQNQIFSIRSERRLRVTICSLFVLLQAPFQPSVAFLVVQCLEIRFNAIIISFKAPLEIDG